MPFEHSHPPRLRSSVFRFYEELNDFLPAAKRKRSFTYRFSGTPAVRDAVQAIGVPHTEIDLILVDGEPVGFEHQLNGGERVAVYPVFERLDISSLNRLRSKPLRDPRFVADVHLGRLARYLRMLGFDTAYRNDLADSEIIEIAKAEQRIILTRDLGILKNSAVTHGYWLRHTHPERQVREVLDQFDLRSRIHSFARCIACNGVLIDADRDAVRNRVPESVYELHASFRQCDTCRKVYWPGSHYARMSRWMRRIVASVSVW